MFFSTNGVANADPREAWIERISGFCGSFETEFDGRGFQGSIDERKVGGFDCARIAQSARATRRTAREVDAGDPGLYYVILQLGGRAAMVQSGREALLEPGDVAVIDSSLPCEFRFDRKILQLSVHLPRARLNAGGAGWSGRTARPLGRSSAVMVGSLMRAAFEQVVPSSDDEDGAVGDALVGLLQASASHGQPSRQTAQPPVSDVVREIQDYLLGRLDDVSLSPAALARRHGLSERQLHRLFQNAGVSLGRWIRQSRLDRCASELRNPQLRERSITEIAFASGFNDAAHFSRSFRAEFGQAPRDYRAMALGRS